MTKHPNAALQSVGELVGNHLDEIKSYFKPGPKITILLRYPEIKDGSQDFVLSDDELEEAAQALLRRKLDPNGLTGDV